MQELPADLSILYLRCVARLGAGRLSRVVALSILYLRCLYRKFNADIYLFDTAFNSLFEMPHT